MTPYYIKQQIHSVRDVSDIVVVEMHAGSEYSLSPGPITITLISQKDLKI